MAETLDWPAIVEQHGPLVWRTVLRVLGDDGEAADCYQETFVAALEISRRQEVSNLPGLLQRIATTQSLDRLRRKVRERGRAVPDVVADRVPSRAPDALAALQAGELVGRLRDALTRLPPREGAVFCLRELNELSYAEIATTLGISEDAAGVATHRARRKLAVLLRDLQPAEPFVRSGGKQR